MIDSVALESILERVKKPARYLGGEWNSIVKADDEVELKVLLSYPDAYELGVSNQGVQILYTVLNGRPEYLCERVYAPWPDMEAELRAANMPLFSLETKRPCRDFDVIGFSLGYETVYTNVLTMLDLSRIPLRSHRPRWYASASSWQEDMRHLTRNPCRPSSMPFASARERKR